MEVDAGNSGPSKFVARFLAGHIGVETTQAVPQAVPLVVGRPTGPRAPVTTVARILPGMAMDGSRGVTCLRQCDVTLNLAAAVAWLAPAAQS